MRHPAAITLTIAALLCPPSSAQAQSAFLLQGTIVRAELGTAGTPRLEGTLVSRTADSLVMVTRGSGAIVRVPAGAIRSLEVLDGKRRIGPAVKWGVIGGAAWGLLMTAIPYKECDPARYRNCGEATTRSQFVAEQVVGMIITAGGIAAWRGEDRWVRVEEAPAAAAFITPSTGRTQVGVRVSF